MKTKLLMILFVLLFISSCKTTELEIDSNATKQNDLTYTSLSIKFDPDSGQTTIKLMGVSRDDYYLNLVNNSSLFTNEFNLSTFSVLKEKYKTDFTESITIEFSLMANKPGNDNVRENIEDLITGFTKKKVEIGSDYSFKNGFDKIILIFAEDDIFDYQNGNATTVLYNDQTKHIALVYDIINKPIMFETFINY